MHPNDHVNRGQSSNDVIPTAIQLAAAMTIKLELLPAMQELEESLRAKSKAWPCAHTSVPQTGLGKRIL